MVGKLSLLSLTLFLWSGQVKSLTKAYTIALSLLRNIVHIKMANENAGGLAEKANRRVGPGSSTPAEGSLKKMD